MIYLSEEQEMIRDMIRKLASDKLAPRIDEIDESDEFPWDFVDILGENGLLRLLLPEDYSGINANTKTLSMVMEEMSTLCLPAAVIIMATSVVQFIIRSRGNDEQKNRFFSTMSKLNKMGAIAITEPDNGSNAANMKTKAVLDDDTYILNGSKCFITNGGVADYYIIFARTGPDKGAKGLSCFVVEKETPGFSIGKKEKKMGMRGSPMAELIFDNAMVPKANLLGNEGDGWRILMEEGNLMRIWGTATIGLGVAQCALDHAVNYSKERVQFNQPIAYFQSIQFKLADMAIKIETARSLIYRVADMLDRGEKNFKMIEALSSMAKCYSTDIAMQITTEAVQVFGGYGYMKDYPVERLMRDAKGGQIADGTNDIQRMIVARYILS